MATFRITKNPGTLSPWVLYPQNDKTVWVVALGGGPPFVSQIINFTLGPQPQEEIVLNLTNALPSSILVDDRSGRVWFPVNDTIAYYDPTTRIVNRTAVVYRGGAPQFLAQDKLGRLWVTLDGSNQIAMFDPSTQLGRNFTVPTPRPSFRESPWHLTVRYGSRRLKRGSWGGWTLTRVILRNILLSSKS